MTRKDFINAMPPMPDSFVERMERTLKRKDAYIMKRNRAKRFIMIVALIGALLIAGGAIALKQSGLLDHLFYNKQPTKEAIELVQSVDKSETGAGVSITIDEYAYDGENVVVSYTLTNNSNDTLIVYNEQGVGFGDLRDEAGSRVHTSSGWMDDGEMYFIGGQVDGVKLESSLNCGQKGSVSAQSRSQTLTFTVSAGVYRPLVPLASSDETAGKGETLVLQNNGLSWSSARNEAAIALWASKGNDTAYEGETLEAMGWIEKIGEVSVTKTLEPKRSEVKGITLKEPIQIDTGEVLLTLESVNFTALASNYSLTIRPKAGADYIEKPYEEGPMYAWQFSDVLDDNGQPIGFTGGGSSGVIAPDGVNESYSRRKADPLTVMPSSFTLCPCKVDYVWREGDERNERYDLTKSIRLEIVNGVVVPPDAPHDRKVVYAPDFAADEAGTGEVLSVKAKTWDEATITRVLAQGKKLKQDDADPDDFRRNDGTMIVMSRDIGRLAYDSGKLGGKYGSVLTSLKGKRSNVGGSIDGFTAEQALSSLDKTLGELGLKRGRTAYQGAYTKKELMNMWVELQMWYKTERREVTQKRLDKLRRQFEKEVLSIKAPKGGYFITFALNYNGLDCVMEDKPTYGLTDRLPAGSSLSAFVNPSGVLFLKTHDYSAVYEASHTGENITLISFDAAKIAAEKYLTLGAADETVEIKRAFYEYKPVWSGENNSQLTLRPVWGFYAERKDKALYPLVYVDAESGEISY